uniref:Secreted protein n=1 Tax=Globodera pallida TaxID=36090 RepID=A0A183BW61_GLOPA
MNSFTLLIIAVGIAIVMMATDVTMADDCCLPSNPANSSSVKLVEPQLKKSLSFNPKSPGDNSTFFNDQQPLQKSLSFKPPKTINSESNDVKMRNILTDWCMTIPNRSC